MKTFTKRLLFVILSTIVVVFFSEKAYWYPQGYVIVELVLFYAFPVYAVLWAIDYFRVRRLSALVLVAALYAFLVEGVLTPVIYEAGLFDPIMPAYFIGWHGLLSVVFGWYFLRKWLVRGQWQRLLASSVLFGLFWGIWSTTYWLPESFSDFTNPGQWPVRDYFFHSLTFTFMLIVGHGLLGHSGWQPELKLGKAEKLILFAVLLFLFVTMVFLVVPFGTLKLALLLTVIFLPLWINRRRENDSAVFAELAGTVRIQHLLGLLLMPVMATSVYVMTASLQPSENLIRAISELISAAQSLVGIVVFVWALITTVWGRRKTEPAPNAPLRQEPAFIEERTAL